MTHDYTDLFQKQRLHHPFVKQTSAKERVHKLKTLKQAILARSNELKEAMHQDFRKAEAEVDLSEIFPTLAELDFTIKRLPKWMKPVRTSTPLALFGTRSEIRYEPKGNVLIIGPWNYPFQLMMAPLISAIAAGNCIILKPSEIAQNTSRFLKSLVSQLFDEKEVACIEGDAAASQALLKLPFDHIFFTGSTRLGKVIMEAASRNLSSVTLELGGKSPAIIDESADLVNAAKRIVWGKFFNAGQTCVAPDYVFVPENKLSQFVDLLKTTLGQRYGDTEADREKSNDLCRIINQSHFQRLKKLTQETIQQGAKLEAGGVFNDENRYIAPTVLSKITHSLPIMQDEIFGPILPIMTYSSLNEVYSTLRSTEKPLALYIFSQDKKRTEEILKNTSAGGTSINNTLLHLLNHHLPFGGVGASGQGNYHGYFGFKTFSHERAILRQGVLDLLKFLHPPYRPHVKSLIQLVVKYLT